MSEKQEFVFWLTYNSYATEILYEDKLAAWAEAQGLRDLSYLHAFSALSCWAQAGDSYRALMLSRKLLQTGALTEPQRSQLQAYYTTLEQRWVSWMQQWSTPALVPALRVP